MKSLALSKEKKDFLRLNHVYLPCPLTPVREPAGGQEPRWHLEGGREGLGASGGGSRGSRRQQGLSLPQGSTSLGSLDVPRMHPGSCPLPKQIQNEFLTFVSFNQCSHSLSCFPERKNNTKGTPQTQSRGAWTTALTRPSALTQTSLRLHVG